MNFFGENQPFFINEVIYKNESVLGPRVNQNFQLVYVFEGQIELNCGKDHVLREGDAILLLPGNHELFRFAAGTHHGWCEVQNANLTDDVIEAYRKISGVNSFPERLRTLHSIAMGVMDRSVYGTEELLTALAQAILHAYFRHVGLTPSQTRPLPATLTRAKNIIEERFAENLCLDDIASHAGLSVQHMGRLFRLHLKTTPIALLWDIRVREGVRLLESTGLNVAEIAYRTGFQNPYHFSRMIKQRIGVPPNRYRNQYWKGTTRNDSNT